MVCFRSSVGSRGDAPAFPPSKPRRFRIATINIRNFRKKQASPRFPRRKNTLPDPNGAHYPAAACGAHPAPTNETTRPQPAEHAAAQADERASITTGHSPLRIGTLRPLRPAAYRNPAPEITRPQPAEHAAAQADERASAGGGCGPRDSEESHPFHSATPVDTRPPILPLRGIPSRRRAPLAPDSSASSRPAAPLHAIPCDTSSRPPRHHSTVRPATTTAARRPTPLLCAPGPATHRASPQNARHTASRYTSPHDTTKPVPLRRATPARIPSERRFRQPPPAAARPPSGPRLPFRPPPAPSAAFRYRPTTASSSSTVTGSRRSPSMRHPSSVTSRSSSMRMPPKSR